MGVNVFGLRHRNLRIREDTAKYLLNLDVNSAYYDPKSRPGRFPELHDGHCGGLVVGKLEGSLCFILGGMAF